MKKGEALIVLIFTILFLPNYLFAAAITLDEPTIQTDYKTWPITYQNSCKLDQQNTFSGFIYIKIDHDKDGDKIFELVNPYFANAKLAYMLHIKGSVNSIKFIYINIPTENRWTIFDARDPTESFQAEIWISEIVTNELKTNLQNFEESCKNFMKDGDAFIRDFLKKLN